MESGVNNWEIQNSAIIRKLSSIYRTRRLKVEQRAQKKVDYCNPANQEDMIFNYIRRYKILNAIFGVVGPIVLTTIIAIWERPKNTDMYGNLNALLIYIICMTIIALIIICFFCLTFWKKDVWERLLDARKKDDREILGKKLEALSKDYDALRDNNAILNERLSLIAYLDDNPDQNPMECLIRRIHGQLGSGEYSVGVYIADKENYTLAEYTESRLSGGKKPSTYKNVLKETGSRHKKYHFFKCLYQNEEGMKCFLKKECINKDNFDGDFQDINQYACYRFKKDKDYNLLLEIIAYNNSTFDKLVPSGEQYFKNLFKTYVPVFSKYASDEVIKDKFKVVS